jgi:hypothetical protein
MHVNPFAILMDRAGSKHDAGMLVLAFLPYFLDRFFNRLRRVDIPARASPDRLAPWPSDGFPFRIATAFRAF